MRTIVSIFLCLYSILTAAASEIHPADSSSPLFRIYEPKVTSLGSDTCLPKVEYNGTPLLVDHTVCNLVLARDQKGVLIGLTEADSRRFAELIRQFGFCERPGHACINYEYVAELWHRLMGGRGYGRYGAQGGDFGAGIATFMALKDPAAMIGLHLSNLEIAPYTGPGSRPLSAAEQTYGETNAAFSAAGTWLQSSPIDQPSNDRLRIERFASGTGCLDPRKWRSWFDSRGRLDERFSRDFLLTTVTLYWGTQTIASSIQDYFDNDNPRFRITLGPDQFVHVPTGIALFFNNFVREGTPPREWAERLYNVQRWTPMASGGHFAAAEEPELLARDVSAFFAGL